MVFGEMFLVAINFYVLIWFLRFRAYHKIWDCCVNFVCEQFPYFVASLNILLLLVDDFSYGVTLQNWLQNSIYSHQFEIKKKILD